MVTGPNMTVSPLFEVGGGWTFANGMVLRPDLAAGAIFHNRGNWDASAQLVGSAPGVAPSGFALQPLGLAPGPGGMAYSASVSFDGYTFYGAIDVDIPALRQFEAWH